MQKLYKYPALIVAIITLITLFFAFQLPRAKLDNNNLRFVPNDDPALETSRWIDKTFGSSFFILVGLQRQYGTVFDADFLNQVRNYGQIIGEIPIVREVTSLINSDYINSVGDAIVVEKLVSDDFSGTPEEIAALKHRLLSWDLYERSLYSDDFTATQILIPLTISSEEAGLSEITEQFIQIRDIAREMFSGLATVYVTGMPIISATINEAMNADLRLLIPLVTLVVLAVLFFSFRALTPVVLPLLTVLIATIWSMGAMPIFDIKLSVISTVLPVILVAVGSAYGIHVVTHYLSDRPGSGGTGSAEMNREEHSEYVLKIVRKIRKPVFLAALTTFVGFSSLCFTSVIPIREFGFFASFGVAVSFIIAITLIPALLIIRGPKPVSRRIEKEGSQDQMSVSLANTLVRVTQKKRTVVFLTCLVLIISLYGFSKIIIDNVMVEYFKSDTDIYKSDDFIRRQFGGSKVVSLVVQADSPEILLHPDTLTAVDGLSVYLQNRVENVGKILGFTDLIKRINQVFNADESPEGLRSTAKASSDNGSFGFGNSAEDFGFGDSGDDFGFGDFGFGSFDSPSVPMAEEKRTAQDNFEDTDRDKVYTQNELIALFEKAGGVSLSMNTNDFIRELRRLVNYEGASYYEIPADPARYGKDNKTELAQLISNYLVLLSGNISQYANDPLEPTVIKSTVQLRTVGMSDSNKIFKEMDNYIKANFPANVKVTVGGTTMVESSLNNLVVRSQLTSVLVSIICVFFIVMISNRSLAAGLIGITPLSISVLINFAIMGFTGIKLNLGTSMVASVSVGIGIDYTIHYLEAFKREYRISGGADFLWRTFTSSGRAIIINAISVGAGFAVLMFSRFNILADLGLLIAITMFSSATVSLTVLPALLLLIKPKFIQRLRNDITENIL